MPTADPARAPKPDSMHLRVAAVGQRMPDWVSSAWTDYNAKLISKGGGIFERSAKSIEPSEQIKKLFGITKSSVTPNELIRAMLGAEVGLLWFGGIGTYVKSSDESHGEVGDRVNDTVDAVQGSQVWRDALDPCRRTTTALRRLPSSL